MSCKCFNRRFVFKNTDSFDHKYVNSKCKCTSRFTICENKSKFTIASKDISEVDKIKESAEKDARQVFNAVASGSVPLIW